MTYDNRVELDTTEFELSLKDGTKSDLYSEHIQEFCLDIVDCFDNYSTELTESELKTLYRRVQDIRETILSHSKGTSDD